ncbi:YdcF family protein [Synechococcus sp. CCY 0621]|uniref:YdcF family protein n=1 Tax=Synechococcus sp. CCY 0621 TaxID=2815603 RepID=UPI0025712C9E|nr:YdcF family protein [Synechococcus sp. CCY 0621]
MLPPGVDWTSCPAAPMAWFSLRDSVLHLLTTPVLLLPLIAALALALGAAAGLRWPATALLSGLAVAVVSFVYSPLTTAALTAWLTSQLPQPPPPTPGPALAVIVGRSPEIAAASTTLAAQMLRQGRIQAIYVSGDGPATAQRLLQLGVPPERLAGDSCARTTWENASLTSTWIREHHSGASGPAILLITDPWQLPRASRAFQRQQLPVTPIPAVPALPPQQSNRLALRESAATLLYGLQGRM